MTLDRLFVLHNQRFIICIGFYHYFHFLLDINIVNVLSMKTTCR